MCISSCDQRAVSYPTTTPSYSNGVPDNVTGASYNYSYDSMYRLNGMTTSANATVVNNVSYNAANQMLGMTFNGESESRTYNVLNQLYTVKDGYSENLTYNYPTGANDGKISSMYNAISGETITYTYDSLNRLATASDSIEGTLQWTEGHGFDSFGSLLSKNLTAGSGAPNASWVVNTATNQTGSVDANGNTLSSYYGTQEYSLGYDPENRVTGVANINGNPFSLSYAYDGQNRRIFSWNGSEDSLNNPINYTVNVYTPGGQKLAAYTMSPDASSCGVTPCLNAALATSDQYFGGRRLAVMDQLGSVENIHQSYFPWGEPKGTSNPQDTWNFATYWADSATGLDYAKNRYYSNAYGRFMTPDPSRPGGGPSNPQSWNRYAYVSGDPVNFRDPRGLMEEEVCGGEDGDPCDDGGGGGGFGGCDASQENCDNPCVGADGFTPSPSPYCQVGGIPAPTLPALPGPDPLGCDVQLFSQPAGPSSDPFDHTLLKVTFSTGTTDYLEGVPIPKNPAKTNVVTDPMWLNASVKTTGTYYSNPTTLIQQWLETDSLCDSLVNLVEGYTNNATTYNNTWPWSGPNSNSFTHSLLNMFGLSVEGGLSNFWYPGWSNTSVSFF